MKQKLILFLLEKIPLFNKVFEFLNGHKTNVGFIVSFISIVLPAVKEGLGVTYPEALAFIEVFEAWFIKVSAIVLTYIGVEHKKIKAEVK